MMEKKTLANRLEAIKKAKPVVCDVPVRHEPVVEKKSAAEKRTESRRAGFKYATVFFEPDSQLECVILDIHAHGARIKLHGAQALPNAVTLAAPGLGFRSKARIIWRRGEETGLKFIK